MSTTIKTNNVPRDVIDAWQLTDKERAEFDYLDWDAIEEGNDSASFVRYRGELCALDQFVRIIPRSGQMGPMGWCHPVEDESPLSKWDGIRTDSYFSGLVIKWERDERGNIDGERVIVGLAMS